MRKAFVIADEGGWPLPERLFTVKNLRVSDAAPVTCGAARLVPEDQVYKL
jgi:hypothetical protein